MQHNVRGPVTVLAAALALGSAAPAWAASTEDIARDYVSANAAQFGVTAADVAQMAVQGSYKTSATGVTHVSLVQRHAGYDVLGSQVTVNVGRDGRIVFAGGNLYKHLRAGATPASLDAPDAVEVAAQALGLDDPAGLRVTESKGSNAVVSGGGISASPIQAKLGWRPAADGSLRLAWQTEIDAASESQRWLTNVDARTGELLDSDDLVIHDDAQHTGAALAAGEQDQRELRAARVRAQDAEPGERRGQLQRLHRFPSESPNDSDRFNITNPADRDASPFGWHDENGAAGPEYTITRGNNAHAFMDQDADNLPDPNSSPDGGAALKFDFPIDFTEHAQAYRDANTANLFYANNMIHDLAWKYGFDEASGNFQTNNYGRGGTGTDYVRAEAADGNGTNNANFSPPTNDGGTPRMQMYLWPGNQIGAQNLVLVDGVEAPINATWARLGPPVTNAGLTGAFVYAGTGCTPELYPAELPAGSWIAVVDGGTTVTNPPTLCPYLTRLQVAQAKGAKAVVVAHNATGAAPAINGSLAATPAITIPSVAVTQADGTALKAAIAAGPKTGGIKKNPAHTGIRDGDLENGIIIHEYGHGISSRLTGGVGNSCLGGNEQAGEGWSDYLALTFTMDPTVDNPDVGRGMGPYALFQGNRNGAGIRPRPYSRNMEIQPFTYDSIKTGGWLNGASLALPHGLGHGWASVLWDLNWDLIDKYGYNRELYQGWNTGGNNRALQYVMDGLKLQGCNPGLVVASKAIIAAAELREPADKCTVWATFARRGLGYSAVQGTTARGDNSEAFDTHPDCARGFENVPAGPAITTVVSGTEVPLRFKVDDGLSGLDIATKNNPYSRQIDCTTRATVTPGQVAITPRPVPVAAVTKAGKTLSVDASGTYTYPWQTTTAWGDTCREFVFTTKTGKQHRSYFKFLAATHVDAPVGGTVPATLGLTLGTNASFAPFVPGVAREYTAHASANVISTAGDAALSVSDPGRLMNGAFSLAEPLQVSFSKSAWTAPVSNDVVDIAFKQLIKANDPLRTGTYSKTLTFTLSTTNP